MDAPSAWRPWPGGGAQPSAALQARVAGTPLEAALAGLQLRHATWTSLSPLPDAGRCAAVGLPIPAPLLAAGADNLPDRARVRRWLHSPAGRRAELDARETLLQRADAAPSDLAALTPGLRAGHAHLDGIQGFGALLAATVPAPPDAFAADAAAGAAWLLEPGRIDGVAEVQRWTLGDAERLREHRWLAAHIRLLLHLGGIDQTDHLTALFDALPAGPLRWYEGWEGIPPDADSLGLWLRVAGVLGRAQDPRVPSWCAPLRDLPGGTVPGTWLVPAGSRPAWGGDRCGGVQAALAMGLLAAGPTEERAHLSALLHDDAPAWHYPEAVAQAWRAEALLAAGRPAPIPSVLVGRDADPLAIAVAVPPMVAAGAPPELLLAALRALARLQRPDGSWPAQPYFLIPGKPPRRADRLLSPEVTTATCVRAMMLGARSHEAR